VNSIRDHIDLLARLFGDDTAFPERPITEGRLSFRDIYEALLDEDVPRRFKPYADRIEQRLSAELPSLQAKVAEQEGETVPEQVINFIKRYDPTPQGTYTEWLILRWLSNTYSLEDLEGIRENLRIFNNKRAQIEIKDILKYKTPIELAAAVRRFIKVDDAVPEYFQGREAEIKSSKHTDILLDNAEFLVVHPKDKESAQYWGFHTGTNGQPWCIAWGIPNTPLKNHSNHFANYTSNDKPFIIFFDKRGHASFRDGPAYAVRLHPDVPMLTLKENGSEIPAIPYLTGTLAPAVTGKVAQILYKRYPWMAADFWEAASDDSIKEIVYRDPGRFYPLAFQHGRAGVDLQRAYLGKIRSFGFANFSPEIAAEARISDLVTIVGQREFEQLPDEFRVNQQFIAGLIHHTHANLSWLPVKYYEKLIPALLSDSPSIFKSLPKQFQTQEAVHKLITDRQTSGRPLDWRFIDQSIPRELWDDEIEGAYWASYSRESRPQIDKVPEKFRTPEIIVTALAAHPEDITKHDHDLLTRENAVQIVRKNFRALDFIPKWFLDQEMADLVVAAAERAGTYEKGAILQKLRVFPTRYWPLSAVDSLVHFGMKWSEMPEHYREDKNALAKFITYSPDESSKIEKRYLTPSLIADKLSVLADKIDPALLTEPVVLSGLAKSVSSYSNSYSNYETNGIYKKLPASAKTPAVMAAFAKSNVVPIDELPDDLHTEDNLTRRASEMPDEVKHIPEKHLTPKLARDLAAKNWRTVKHFPERLLTEPVLEAFLSNVQGSSYWGASRKESEILFKRFPEQVWSRQTTYDAIDKGLLASDFGGIPEHLLDEPICALIVSRNNSALDHIPAHFRTEETLADAVKRSVGLLEKLKPADLTEPVLNAAARHASPSTYYADILKKLPRENWSQRVWEQMAGYVVPLKDVPARFRKKATVIKSLVRDASNVAALKDPAKWVASLPAAFENQDQKWTQTADAYGLASQRVKGKITFQNAVDLPRTQLESGNGSYAIIPIGKVNKKFYVFNKSGKLVFFMYTDKDKVIAPDVMRGLPNNKLIAEVSGKVFGRYTDANDLNDIGIYSGGRDGWQTEDTLTRTEIDGLTWTYAGHRTGARHTLWLGKNPALRITTGRSGSGWSTTHGIQEVDMPNAKALIPLAPKIAAYIDRKISDARGYWKLRWIGIVTKRDGSNIALTERKTGEIEGLSVWMANPADGKEYVTLVRDGSVLAYAMVKKNGSLTASQTVLSSSGDVLVQRVFENLEKVLIESRKKKSKKKSS
jgi:hypothetical protein